MKTAEELDYTLHHLCIYDENPRENMWSYLKWHHGITNFFTGASYHITDEGHSDYTFLGCGGRAFQIQLETPPFQFKYEQNWFKKYGSGCNHICWVVNDAKSSFEQLKAAGAEIMQEYQPFPTYDGFVMADPEGRWIEIMEYTDPHFRVQEFTPAPSGPCGLEMTGFVEVVKDLDRMLDWYQQAMGMKVISEKRDGKEGIIFLSDRHFDQKERCSTMVLTTPRSNHEKSGYDKWGAFISGILYQAQNVQSAWDDALWAGMEAVAEPKQDSLTGAVTAYLREPSGNEITLREALRVN